MKLALVPTVNGEDRRWAALDRYAILDTQPEQAFDDIAWFASAIFTSADLDPHADVRQ